MSLEVPSKVVKQEIPVQGQEQLEEKAKEFWETRLQNETRIAMPQDTRCEFSIVVPVKNEKSERILRQIESLRNQQDVDPAAFEVIYVVGNDVPDGTEKSKKIVEANHAVLEALQNVPGLHVFAIDKSSMGHEIEECNVGKARNRGIVEASRRFYENKKDGILIQTDADSYFEDPYYLKKIGDVLRQNPDTLGIAGGFVFEFDPDTSDPAEIELLKAKVDRFKLLKEWEYMVDFLQDPEAQVFLQDDAFVGPNTISRSFETAAVGGVDDTSLGEQDNLGRHLKDLAAERGHRDRGVLGMKKDLVVITALRESDRTMGSFKAAFDEIDLEKPLVGPDPSAPKLSEVRQKILTQIEANLHNPDGLRKTLSDSEGRLLCEEEGLQELTAYLATRQKLDIAEPFFVDWLQKYGAPMRALYDPRVPITQEGLQELETKVLQHPDGRKFIDNMRSRLTNIRFKQH